MILELGYPVSEHEPFHEILLPTNLAVSVAHSVSDSTAWLAVALDSS